MDPTSWCPTNLDAPHASFGYDANSRLLSRTDAAGTATFSYTTRGQLATATDTLSGVTRSYGYDTAAQLTSIGYSKSGSSSTRTFAYNDLGRKTGEQLKDASAAVTASYAYGYDADGNVTSQTVTLPSNPANGTHIYSYDQQNRLTSWTTPVGAETNYTWDAAGNRTGAGAATYTYDQRNRLLSGPDGTRTWSPQGNLTTLTAPGGAETSYGYDAFNRLTSVAPASGSAISSTYDSLDRLVTRNGIPATYSGVSTKTNHYGNESFARTEDDSLLAISDGTTTSLPGTNIHHDLTYLAAADGTVGANRIYDPFGNLVGSSGTMGVSLGYQSDFTDPTTGQVWMAARWYDPAGAGFTTEDTVTGDVADPRSLNLYSYVQGNPVTSYDPTGHAPAPEGGVSWYRNLRLQGSLMRGQDVKWVQYSLNMLGYGLQPDGVFGPRTASAVTSFQARFHLEADGIVGPRTWTALEQVRVVAAAYFTSLAAATPTPQKTKDGCRGFGFFCGIWQEGRDQVVGVYSLVRHPVQSWNALKDGGPTGPFKQAFSDFVSQLSGCADRKGKACGAAFLNLVELGAGPIGAVSKGAKLGKAGGAAEGGGRLLWTSWQNYPKVVQGGREYAQIGDRLYARHAVDRMQPSGLGAPAGATGAGRSISPNFVEDVLSSTRGVAVKGPNGEARLSFTSGTVQVITEDNIVITVITR